MEDTEILKNIFPLTFIAVLRVWFLAIVWTLYQAKLLCGVMLQCCGRAWSEVPQADRVIPRDARMHWLTVRRAQPPLAIAVYVYDRGRTLPPVMTRPFLRVKCTNIIQVSCLCWALEWKLLFCTPPSLYVRIHVQGFVFVYEPSATHRPVSIEKYGIEIASYLYDWDILRRQCCLRFLWVIRCSVSNWQIYIPLSG